jgi:hypothetical protein
MESGDKLIDMKRQLRVVLLVASVACGLSKASAKESFLNQKLPTTWVIYRSDTELLQVLKSVVPKTFIQPEGMSVPEGLPEPKPLTNPTEAKIKRAMPHTMGCAGALFGRVPGDKTPFTVRDYLNEAVRFIGMTWNYDATRDAVVLDFPWHVNDPRSNAELMDTLAKTVPPEDEKLIETSSPDPKTDPWQAAFNTLLSKPENFPKTWQVRWKVDDDFPVFEKPVTIFSGKILDETGTSHFVILNMQTSGLVANLEARWATISFYLFSGEGKFEQGGLFTAFDRWGKTSVVLDAGQKRLSVHTDYQSGFDQVFKVEKNRLVFQEDLVGGQPPTAEQKWTFLDRRLFEVNAD